jgi:XTP/dITP diphosphohydrolase
MKVQLKKKVIFFATNNFNKFNEASKIFSKYRITLVMLKVKDFEIQSDSLEEIALKSVKEVVKKYSLPIIVEDAGLFINVLNGFPGPYSSFVYKTLGNKGILKLMEKMENRKASFKSAIAYYSNDLEKPICFCGETIGIISRFKKDSNKDTAFGFDPIFKPEKSKKMFGEMTLIEKNRYSHRIKALKKFLDWYIMQYNNVFKQ